ncbi:hypothetical protein OAO87_04065 [bacterium]|nr:hypothetical protein [bacterium]
MLIEAQSFHSAPYPLPHRVLAFIIDELYASPEQVTFARAAHARFSRKYAANVSDDVRGCGAVDGVVAPVVPILTYRRDRRDAFVELV